jgi:hypothetical protein
MYSSKLEILIRHNLISLPITDVGEPSLPVLVTILNNLSYYGYALSQQSYDQLAKCPDLAMISWWGGVEGVLAKITGDDKKMADFVVYKNFPKEVLEMSEAEYWGKQILMYWGFPNQYFTQPEAPRPELNEKLTFKVLHLAQTNSLERIFTDLLYLPNRWTDQQSADLVYLLPEFGEKVETEKMQFKENLIYLLIYCLAQNQPIEVTSATDVLRLAAGLSEGDISLRVNSKFRKFKRSERRFLLQLLNKAKNLLEDINRRKNTWKKLFYVLHPGDYAEQYPHVATAYNQLYQDLKIPTFNSKLEQLLLAKDKGVLELLKTRPGEFLRRLRHCVDLFGLEAVNAFVEIIPKLKLIQLLKLQGYWETINYRLYRAIAPKGNWTKLQVITIEAVQPLDEQIIKKILEAIALEIKTRISPIVPSVKLYPQTDLIKLQTNDSDLTPYGRGTAFIIPDNIRFIRTASYWQSGPTSYNIWYDNSWNFFDQAWSPLGSCCWNYPFFREAAIFSGDPTNTKDAEGNACQLIDLYLDKLLEANVRYAVWNILCFSHLAFDEAKVFAALQWGEKPDTGKLFEPSRCQLAFPLKGQNFTKYIAYLDLYQDQIVYLDANLKASTFSADYNSETLREKMPAFVEYLDTLPSVFDLFKHLPQGVEGLCVAYSDADISLDGQEAYIFRPENRNNQFKSFSLSSLLNL